MAKASLFLPNRIEHTKIGPIGVLLSPPTNAAQSRESELGRHAIGVRGLAAVGAEHCPLRHKIDRAERIFVALIRCSAGDDADGVPPPSKENIPEFKSKAVLLPKREQFTFVLSILAKTDFDVRFAARHALLCKTMRMGISFDFHSFLWLCSM